MNNRSTVARTSCLLIVFQLAVPTSGRPGQHSNWKEFKSAESGFSVKYPGSWYPFVSNKGSLDILSFPPAERVQGVVLKRGGAEIMVGGPPSGVTSIDQWVRAVEQDNRVKEDKSVKLIRAASNGCAELRQVVTESEAGEGVYFTQTSYYCSIGNKLLTVFLENWKGDPNEKRFQELALRIASSLRWQ